MSQKAKNQQSRLKENIDKRAMKDAQFLWKTLLDYFYLEPKDDTSLVTSFTINVCFCEKSQGFLKYATNRVFIAHGTSSKCLLLSNKKVRYPRETSFFLQQMAVNYGFTVCNQGYSNKLHCDNFLDVNMCSVYGEWIAVTS